MCTTPSDTLRRTFFFFGAAALSSVFAGWFAMNDPRN
jgi:hypothetical protein